LRGSATVSGLGPDRSCAAAASRRREIASVVEWKLARHLGTLTDRQLRCKRTTGTNGLSRDRVPSNHKSQSGGAISARIPNSQL